MSTTKKPKLAGEAAASIALDGQTFDEGSDEEPDKDGHILIKIKPANSEQRKKNEEHWEKVADYSDKDLSATEEELKLFRDITNLTNDIDECDEGECESCDLCKTRRITLFRSFVQKEVERASKLAYENCNRELACVAQIAEKHEQQAVEKEMTALREYTNRINEFKPPSEGYVALSRVRKYIDTRWPKTRGD